MSMYCRPQVSARVHIMREAEVGRYQNNNLVTLMWCERFLQFTNDREQITYDRLRAQVLEKKLYL